VLTVKLYAADPATGVAAITNATATHTLSDAEAALFVSGHSGATFAPQATDYRWDDFRIDPLGGSTELLLDSESLDLTGFAGAQTTRTGAYTGGTTANHVVRATLTTNPVAVCGLGNLGHVGNLRVKARLYGVVAGSTLPGDLKVRLTYREGDGPWRSTPWTSPVSLSAFSETFLGAITIQEKTLGSQRWTGKIEAYSLASGDTIDVDYVELIPNDRYGKGRAPIMFETVTSFTARDEFDQVAGNLNAKAAAVGGNWATSGAATDWVVETTGKTAERTSTLDASNGRFAISGLAASAAQFSQVDFKTSVLGPNMGVVCRWVDVNNRFSAVVLSGIPGGGNTNLRVTKLVGGVVTTLIPEGHIGTLVAGSWYTLRLLVDAAGRWYVWFFPRGGNAGEPVLSGIDADLATGGVLATGQVGFRDSNSPATAATRNYDNFLAATPSEAAVMFSGRSAEIRHDSALRQDSSGAYYGDIPSYRGAKFLLPAAGPTNRTTRMFYKARRNDVDVLPDDSIADSTTVTVHYIPQYLFPR
jgi:hypothetical protein